MAALEKVLVLEISGKIIELLPEKSGQSANGEWRKREYVLETEAQYPKKICFMAWGDKIDQFEIKQGERVTVSVDLESREYNGRWYTDVKAWKVLETALMLKGPALKTLLLRTFRNLITVISLFRQGFSVALQVFVT